MIACHLRLEIVAGGTDKTPGALLFLPLGRSSTVPARPQVSSFGHEARLRPHLAGNPNSGSPPPALKRSEVIDQKPDGRSLATLPR